MMNGNKLILLQPAVSGRFQVLKDYLTLLKPHLCLYIGLSAIFGHVMAVQAFSINTLYLGGAVMVLACGAAVLNNIQDREYDLFFPRTCDRSLPRKRVPVFHAEILALLMITSGLSGLLLVQGMIPFFWGVMAVVCYNGVYTPLKKRSLLAIIPGSLVGMLPPLIGWTAAGKAAPGFSILLIMIVFGLWQIPHFFIFLLKTGKLYSEKEDIYKFPCFFTFFSRNEIKLQALIWTSLYSLSILLFLINGSITHHLLSIVTGLNAIGITLLISGILIKKREEHRPLAFTAINLSMLFFMGTGICDKGFF